MHSAMKARAARVARETGRYVLVWALFEDDSLQTWYTSKGVAHD